MLVFKLIYAGKLGPPMQMLTNIYKGPWYHMASLNHRELIKTLSCYVFWALIPLQWRHNGRDSVSNHQPLDCLLNRLFRRRSKKTSKIRVTGLVTNVIQTVTFKSINLTRIVVMLKKWYWGLSLCLYFLVRNKLMNLNADPTPSWMPYGRNNWSLGCKA